MNISNYFDSTDAIWFIFFGIMDNFFKTKCCTKFTAAHICYTWYLQLNRGTKLSRLAIFFLHFNDRLGHQVKRGFFKFFLASWQHFKSGSRCLCSKILQKVPCSKIPETY
jgi:hypothetical protein